MGNKPIERITSSYIFNEILKVLNLQRGLILTSKTLILNPSQVVRTYLFHDRKHYSPPITFSVFWVGLWTLLLNVAIGDSIKQAGLQNMQKGFEKSEGKENVSGEEVEQINKIFADLLENYLGYQNALNFLFIPVVALVTYLVYRFVKLHYIEHIVLNLYATGMVSFIGIVCLVFEFVSPGMGLQTGGYIAAIYMVWYYMDVFKQRDFNGFLRGFVAVTLYYIFIFITVGLLFILYAAYLVKTGALE